MSNKIYDKIKNDQKGMTIIEILVVLVILGGLVAILVPNVMNSLQKANQSEVKVQMGELGKQLDMFYTDCGFYPSSEQGLLALVEPPASDPKCESWGPEPYIKKVPKDPWKVDFVYEQKGSGYVLISLGRDKREGGSGFDSDISSEDL